MTIEERIEKTFDSKLEQFLCDDVGFVKFHRLGTGHKDNWGIIESQNGDVLFFTKAVRTYVFSGASKPFKEAVQLTKPLAQGQAVTFRVQPQEDGRLRAPEVVVWDGPLFESILQQIEERPVYQFVSSRPARGGLGMQATENRNETLWRGKNLFHLRRKYPQDRWPVTDSRFFEELNVITEEWSPCGDPR